MDPIWLVVIVVTQRVCNDRWEVPNDQIGVVSHHLRSLLGGLELTVLYAFLYRVGYFDSQIRMTLLYK